MSIVITNIKSPVNEDGLYTVYLVTQNGPKINLLRDSFFKK
jgi:hypothetical protein